MKAQNLQAERSKPRGFSLTELMIVVAVVMVVAVVAIPNILQGMRFIRLRSNASSIAVLLQQARMRSVRDNRAYQVNFQQNPVGMPNTSVVYIDTNFNGAYTPGEPVVLLANDVLLSNVSPPAGPDPFIAAAMAPTSWAQMALQDMNTALPGPTFNPRGVPCRVAANGLSSPITPCPTTAGGGGQVIGYVVYLQSTTAGLGGWSAITVSPGGRIRTWIYARGVPERWR